MQTIAKKLTKAKRFEKIFSTILQESGGSQQITSTDLQLHHVPQMVHALSAPSNVASPVEAQLLSASTATASAESRCQSRKSRHLSDISQDSEDSEFDRQQPNLSIDQILGHDFGSTGDLNLTLDKWRSTVEGRELVNEVYPVSVDQLFTLLFTNSKFYMDFHANRKTFGE